MNFWTIVALIAAGLFTLIATLNTALKNKPVAVFIFMAGLASLIYLVFYVDLPNDWLRYMFIFLFLFQFFCFASVLLSQPNKQRRFHY